MLNEKWVGVDAVIERAARVFPDLEINRNDAAEWCLEVVKDVGVFPSFKEKVQVVDVVNNMAEVPCDSFRVLHVVPYGASSNKYTSHFRENWYNINEGRYINLASNNSFRGPEKVEIRYLGFALDESGLPMIFEGATEAAMWYLVMRLKTADFINGSMPPDRFQYIENKYLDEMNLARSRTMRWNTREDLDRIVKVARSIIRPAHYSPR